MKMTNFTVQLNSSADFESLRSNLMACGVDISSMKVVGSYSDAPAPLNGAHLVNTLREITAGFGTTEGQVRWYADNVLRGAVVMRLVVQDDHVADLVGRLVESVLVNSTSMLDAKGPSRAERDRH